MTTQQRPGWYPAPDGSAAEQWWNGASWSDTRRAPGGAPLPAYQAAPPTTPMTPMTTMPPAAPGQALRPEPYPTLQQASPVARTITAGNSTPIIAFVLGMTGIFIFPLLGIGGILLGFRALRSPTTHVAQRGLAIAGVVTGIIALGWGLIQLLLLMLALTGAPS